MADLKPGDKIVCRVHSSKIVSAYSEFEEEMIFEILLAEAKGNYIYVPDYYNIKNVIEITQVNSKRLGIPKKFIGGHLIHILNEQISRVYSILDGCICVECDQFYDMAEPNQEDGTLICFSCRLYPIWNSGPDDDYN